MRSGGIGLRVDQLEGRDVPDAALVSAQFASWQSYVQTMYEAAGTEVPAEVAAAAVNADAVDGNGVDVISMVVPVTSPTGEAWQALVPVGISAADEEVASQYGPHGLLGPPEPPPSRPPALPPAPRPAPVPTPVNPNDIFPSNPGTPYSYVPWWMVPYGQVMPITPTPGSQGVPDYNLPGPPPNLLPPGYRPIPPVPNDQRPPAPRPTGNSSQLSQAPPDSTSPSDLPA